MSFFSLIIKPFVWLAKVFVSHAVSAAPVAITITEGIKTLLANPISSLLENIADTVTGTNLPTAVANDINAIIPKILAVELGIEGLPQNPTADQILTFEQAVLSAFNVKSNNSKLYTELGAQIYGIIQASVNSSTGINFATLVADVEQAYIDYQKDLAANATVSTADTATKADATITATENAGIQSATNQTSQGLAQPQPQQSVSDLLSGNQTTAKYVPGEGS